MPGNSAVKRISPRFANESPAISAEGRDDRAVCLAFRRAASAIGVGVEAAQTVLEYAYTPPCLAAELSVLTGLARGDLGSRSGF